MPPPSESREVRDSGGQDLGTGPTVDDGVCETDAYPKPGVLGQSSQGGKPGSLGGVPVPDPFEPFWAQRNQSSDIGGEDSTSPAQEAGA